jgi:hypothetical protein
MRRHIFHVITVPLLVALVVAATAGVSEAKAKGAATPTIKSAVGSASVSVGSTVSDTVTVTGKAKYGSPTGTVTINACGPTSSATPCTTPNMGSATVSLSPGSKNRSTAIADLTPTSAGWYCFLDDYNGDTHYKPVSDNNAKTECFDATGSSTGSITPTIKSALTSASIPLGSTDTDTVTVTGTSAAGSPTGTVTFSACGPTTSATPCTSPNAGSATVELSSGPNNTATASAFLDPDATGWYCFLDQYSGDGNYSAVSDNNTATECVDVTGSSTGTTTPTLKSAFTSSSIPLGSTDMDTATVTGTSAAGSPTGTVTFSACGPTTSATPCTSPNAGSATAELSSGPSDTATASATLDPDTTGWYCFLDQYSGDGNYKAVSDNNTATECVDVTGSSTGSVTPTLKSVLSSSSVPYGSSAVDTATVTGTTADGSPTGTLTFYACGPTSAATACTSPNVGPATEEVSPESGDRATASVTINPGAPGWYCFLDQYSGDGNYNAVSDNDTSTECLDVTGSSSTADAGARSTVMTTDGAVSKPEARSVVT